MVDQQLNLCGLDGSAVGKPPLWFLVACMVYAFDVYDLYARGHRCLTKNLDLSSWAPSPAITTIIQPRIGEKISEELSVRLIKICNDHKLCRWWKSHLVLIEHQHGMCLDCTRLSLLSISHNLSPVICQLQFIKQNWTLWHPRPSWGWRFRVKKWAAFRQRVTSTRCCPLWAVFLSKKIVNYKKIFFL